MLLENKTAVIYAAGGAIGGAVARAFAREGARLFLTGRNVAKVDAVAREIVAAGGAAETAQVDALDDTGVGEHLDTMLERAGRVDISFNATGLGPAPDRKPLTGLAGDAFARPIAFHAGSNFITATAAARRMNGRGSGVILTLTALPARMPANLIGGQAPAWAAVEAFSRSLALEVGPAGIRVVCLRAHAIRESPVIEANFATAAQAAGVTPAQWRARLEQSTLLKRLPTLAEVADTAAFVASDRAGAMTATVVNLSAGSLADRGVSSGRSWQPSRPVRDGDDDAAVLGPAGLTGAVGDRLGGAAADDRRPCAAGCVERAADNVARAGLSGLVATARRSGELVRRRGPHVIGGGDRQAVDAARAAGGRTFEGRGAVAVVGEGHAGRQRALYGQRRGRAPRSATRPALGFVRAAEPPRFGPSDVSIDAASRVTTARLRDIGPLALFAVVP